MSIASLAKKVPQNASSRLMNYRAEKNGIHPGEARPPCGRLPKPKTVFVTQTSMSEVSCVPPMKGFRGNPSRRELHKDVHQVTTCPVDDNRVYANTQNGVYVSTDRGHSWENRIEGLPRRYGTAIAVHPKDPDLLIATVQNGPRGGGAWLCHSENGGRTWTQLNDQLTESIDRISTGCVAFTSDSTAWAALGKTLYIGQERATVWTPFWTPPEYNGTHQPDSDDSALSSLPEYPIQTLAV